MKRKYTDFLDVPVNPLLVEEFKKNQLNKKFDKFTTQRFIDMYLK